MLEALDPAVQPPDRVAGKPFDEWFSAGFKSLPPEIRLDILDKLEDEPRIILFHEMIETKGRYPIPPIALIKSYFNCKTEARYEHAINGSYINYRRDIIVCDCRMTESTIDPRLQAMAPKVTRALYWDCFPDDGGFDNFRMPDGTVVSERRYHPGWGSVDCSKFWFPNIVDMWIVKVGELEPETMTHQNRFFDDPLPHEKELAKEFAFYIAEDKIEMTDLNLDEPTNKLVVANGRCVDPKCRDHNKNIARTISKVTFIDEPDDGSGKDGREWRKIKPWSPPPSLSPYFMDIGRLRWVLTSKTLGQSLSYGDEDERPNVVRTPTRAVVTDPNRIFPNHDL